MSTHTGATLGPVIDSLHNQCLLRYNVAPITISSDGQEPFFFASSLLVPPLLGVAYVVLGAILPRCLQKWIDTLSPVLKEKEELQMERPSTLRLGLKAIAAVLSTAAIVKLSEYLVLHPGGGGGILGNTAAFESATVLEQQLLILITVAVVQWAYLDGTLAGLLLASVSSIGGPLSELPFVAARVWEYLPEVSDYFPMAKFDPESGLGVLLSNTLGKNYQSLGLSSITGPCYFAVTIDSISLGRFFDATSRDETTTTKPDSVNGDQNNGNDFPTSNIASSDGATPMLSVALSEDCDEAPSTSSSV